jgi:hypothetical protein
MSLKVTDVTHISVEVAETLYAKLVTDVTHTSVEVAETLYAKLVADLQHSNIEVEDISYASLEAVGIVSDSHPKNQIIREIAQVVEQFIVTTDKALSDLYDVSDASSFAFSKQAADNIVDILEFNEVTLNKVIKDTSIAIDMATFILSKAYADYIAVKDKVGLATNKPLLHAVTTNDSVHRAVTFVRNFADYVVIDDFSSVDKHYTGVKTNIAAVEDKANYGIIKPLQDIGIVEDLKYLLLTKPVVDATIITDEYITDIGKNLFETLASFDNLALGLSKSVTPDSVTTLEYITSVLGKHFADSSYTSDAFAVTVQFIRTLFDTSSIEDALQVDTNKTTRDTVGNLDYNTIDTTKTLLEDITTLDLISLALFISMPEDVMTASDNNSINSTKIAADAVFTADLLMLILHAVYNDVVITGDKLVTSINKTTFDAATIDDQPITSSLLHKADSTLVTDSSSYTVSYIRRFNDAVALDDFIIAARAIDASKLNVSYVVDSLATSAHKVLQDGCILLEQSVIMQNKPISDVFLVSDVASVVQLFGFTSTFNAYAFNTSAFG